MYVLSVASFKKYILGVIDNCLNKNGILVICIYLKFHSSPLSFRTFILVIYVSEFYYCGPFSLELLAYVKDLVLLIVTWTI